MSSAKTGVLQLAPQTGEQAQCYIDLARLLVTGTRSFYNNPTFSDITLVCPDGRQLRCHQVILAASSKRLASVLKQGGFTGAKLPVQGVDSDALDTLIDSFYTGECPLTLATAASIYDAAVKLEVNGLPNAVEQFVSASLTPNNACLLLDRALTTKTGRLAEVCLQFIRARLSEVVPTLEFSAANMDVVVHICTDVAANRHAPQLALQVAISWLRGPPSGPSRTHLLPVLADQIGISPDLLQTYMRTSGNTPGVGSAAAAAGVGGGGGNGGGITAVSLQGEPPSLDDTLTLNSLPLLQLLPPGQLQQLGMGGGAASAAAAHLLLAQSKGGGTAALRSLLEEEGAAGGCGGGASIGVDGASLAQRLGNLAGLRRELEEGALVVAAAAAAGGGTSGRGKRPRTEEAQRSSGWEQGMQRTEQEQQPPSMGRGLSGDQDMLSSPAAAGGGGGGGGGGAGFAGSAGVGQMAPPPPAPTYPDPPQRDRRTLQVKGVCHVEGCYADLTGLRDYHLRYKICEFHLKVSSVLKDGVPQRFCQQCGRFHHLTEFDGSRRSCRTMLARHNMRRAKKLGQGGSPMADDGGAGNAGSNVGGTPAAAGAAGTGVQGVGNDISTKLIQQLGMAAMATLGGSSGGQQQHQAGAQQQQQLTQLGIPDGMSLTDAVAAAMVGLQGNSSPGSGVGGGGATGLLSSPVGRRLNELLDGLGRGANGSVGGVQVGSLLEALTGVTGGGGTGNNGGTPRGGSSGMEGGHEDGGSRDGAGVGIGDAMGAGIAGAHTSEDNDSKRAVGDPVAALEVIAAAAAAAEAGEAGSS
ncbi:hypothetical protein VaNZ11_013167, partial [Volvox africanus]